MTTSAIIIADSITPSGQRITTFQLRFWRAILPELNTHRVFSRNTASTRAIPVKAMITNIRKDPAMPLHWGQNQPGMQASDELTPFKRKLAKTLWLSAMWVATFFASIGAKLGMHKQTIGRILEPFAHSSTVVTSTEWSNFYALRRHPDAQPEIKALADAMFAAHQASTPKLLGAGEWHLPYIQEKDRDDATAFIEENPTFALPTRFVEDLPFEIDHKTQYLLAVSVARCARISYKLHDGITTSFDSDIKLYARLLAAQPLHASPAEHQAAPLHLLTGKDSHNWSGNLRGVVQFRKILSGETM